MSLIIWAALLLLGGVLYDYRRRTSHQITELQKEISKLRKFTGLAKDEMNRVDSMMGPGDYEE